MTFEQEVREELKIINDEMGEIKEDMAEIKTDLDWLKRFFWIIAGSSIGALIAILIK
jgi:predicted acylesterase/phospholipase RssA